MKTNVKKLYRFEFSIPWGAKLKGCFVHNEKDFIEKMGQKIIISECEGECSGQKIEVEINTENIKEITDDQDFIEKFEKYNLESGINPFNEIYWWLKNES